MQIQINAGDVSVSEAINEHVHQRVTGALEHWVDQVTRVEVHLRDTNGSNKAGLDKQCTMEVRLAKHQPMVVEELTDDLYESITGASKKMSKMVRRKLEKLHRT